MIMSVSVRAALKIKALESVALGLRLCLSLGCK